MSVNRVFLGVVASLFMVLNISVFAEESESHNRLTKNERDAGWRMLFNGENLEGWKPAENPSSFQVVDGELIVDGKRAHLFYTGKVENAEFDDFYFKADVMTKPGANSGIYFHTEYQDHGWPRKGYEAQVNNSHTDKKRTGSLFDAANNYEQVAKDNEWFEYEIIVKGKHVVTKVDGEKVIDYKEAKDVNFKGWPGRRLSEGTFAIQAHDPDSEIHYRNIKVKPL